MNALHRPLVASALLSFFASFAPDSAAQAVFGPVKKVSYPSLGALHYDMQAGRLNGDCYPDVVVTSRGIVEGLGVYLGGPEGVSPAGAFVQMGFTTTSPTVKSAVIIDLDMDGIGEIFVLQGTDMRIVDFDGLNFTPGPFVPAPVVGISARARPHDVDNDGDEDIVMSTWNSGVPGGLAVLLSDGHGNLTTSFTMPGNIPSFEMADLNGDNLLDLVTCIQAGIPRAEVRMNQGAGTFGSPAIYNVGVEWLEEMRKFDVDHDGDMDFVADTAGSIVTFFNIGGGVLSINTNSWANYPTGLGINSWTELADLDKDGDIDALIGVPVNTFWYWDDPLSALSPMGMQVAGPVGQSLVVDLDRNGFLDVVTAGYDLQFRLNVTGNASPTLGKMGTSVNSGAFDATTKNFTDGDTIRFGTDIAGEPCLAGKPAAIICNIPPYSALSAVTPLPNNFSFPNLSILTPWSAPQGIGIFCGNSLWTLPPIAGFVDAGFGPLHMGDAPFSIIMPAGLLAPGDKLRFQAIYYDPIPGQNVITLGLVATNAVELVKN